MKNFVKGFGIGLLAALVIGAGLALYFHLSSPKVSEPEEPLEAETEEFPEEGTDNQPETSEEPAETKAEEAEPELPADVTLAFAGDVMFSDAYLSAYDSSGVSAIADDTMLSRMQEAGLFMINEEFPFSLQGEPMEDKQYTFRTDPKYVQIFQDLGVDAVTLANNHTLDYGRDAFCDTLDTLNQAEIAYVGGGYDLDEASAPLIRTLNGQTFAIFAATRVSPSYDWYATDSQAGLFQTYDATALNAAIEEADGLYDHVIVFVHWGIEQNDTPEEYQRALAEGYIDAGADLVVGCHPHVLQGFEYYNGVPIVYSLGNYLFGNRDGETLLLNATFADDGSLELALIPCKCSGGVLSVIEQPESLYSHLTEISFDVQITEEGIVTSR